MQEQLGGMPRRLVTATPSRLATWQQCPRRYRYTYLDRPTPPKRGPWAHNAVGNAAHLALAGWWRLEPVRRTVAEAVALVARAWPDPGTGGFADDDQSRRWRDRVRTMVGDYVATLDPQDEPRGVERTVAVTHRGTALSGRVDRIDEVDGALVVVDYKTGRSPLTLHDAKSSAALAVYAAAATRTLRQPCHRVELHHLPTGEVHAWDHDDASLTRQLDRADAIAAETADAGARHRDGADGDQDFPAEVSALCGWCDFRPVCPEGSQAVPARPLWAGVEEPDR